MWKKISTWQSVMWRISAHDNLSFGEISPHERFFLHTTVQNSGLTSLKVYKYEIDQVNWHVAPILSFVEIGLILFSWQKSSYENTMIII